MELCSAKLKNQKGSPLNFLKSLFLKCILWNRRPGWITISNIELRNHGWAMNRETKSLAVWKLNQAQLIGVHEPQPGKALKVFRPDIKGEYDER